MQSPRRRQGCQHGLRYLFDGALHNVTRANSGSRSVPRALATPSGRCFQTAVVKSYKTVWTMGHKIRQAMAAWKPTTNWLA